MNNYKYDDRNNFIVGDKIVLCVLSKEDVLFSRWFGWFNDEEVTQYLQKHYYPNSIITQLRFFEDIENNSTKIQLGIRKKDSIDTLLGIISLQEIDMINRTAEISLVIGDKKAKDLVTAYEAMKLLFKHAFNTLNLNRITLGYLEPLKYWGEFLIKRFNFKKEGVLRKHVYKNGEYVDVILLGVLKEEIAL